MSCRKLKNRSQAGVLLIRRNGFLCSDGKEFCNDFERHAFCFGNFKVDKHHGHDTDNSIEPEYAGKSNGIEHHGETICDDDVTYPECESTDGNTDTTDSSREDLCTENVGYRTESHDKAAEVEYDAECRKDCMQKRVHGHDVGDD